MRARPFILVLLCAGVPTSGCGGDSTSINPVPLPDASLEAGSDGSASDAADAADARNEADAAHDADASDDAHAEADAPDSMDGGKGTGDADGGDAAADHVDEEAATEAGGEAGPDAPDDGGVETEAHDAGPSYPVRIVAANLTSGTMQSWDPGHGLRILQGLEPDVALIQEFNYGSNTPADWQSFANLALGAGASVFREPDGQIPNGVISRYPILQSGEWEDPYVDNRDFAWARIDLPGDKDLWVISVHLLSGSPTSRSQEAQSLINAMTSQIPAGALVVLGGDFNTDTRSEACITTFSARLVTAEPWPADQASNSNTNTSRAKPYDWVVASPSLQALEIPVVIGANSFDHGLVFDSRVYAPLADVSPVLQSDSAASGMQHMAVVRQFSIP